MLVFNNIHVGDINGDYTAVYGAVLYGLFLFCFVKSHIS